jgi:hypothetical protein
VSGLTYITTCPFCPKKFEHSQFETLFDPTTGFKPEAHKVMESFSRHMFEKHAEHWASEVIIKPSIMSTMCLLKLFGGTTQDASIFKIVEWFRYDLHKFTAASTLPDEKLEFQVKTVAEATNGCPVDDEPLAITSTAALNLLKTLRDILEERPPFTPPRPGVTR